MLFIVRFVDKPECAEIRKEFLPAHINWLDEHHSVVRVPGSLRTEPNTTPVGAVWIVEAQNKVEIEALIRNDPFWINGLRQSYEVLYWSKAFQDRQVHV